MRSRTRAITVSSLALMIALAAGLAPVLEARPRGRNEAAIPDPFVLDSEIARYLARRIKPSLQPDARLQALLDILFDEEDGLGITYGNQKTLGAIETFHSRSGNCLSFTLLFVAMARHVGLRAYFQEVEEVTSWDRRGELVVIQRHMFAEVEIRNGHVQVDFLPGAEKRYRHVRRIDERRARAHFYNNLGVERLAEDDMDAASANFRLSLEHDPRFTPALTNLGVCQRRQGLLEAAEATYGQALAISPSDSTALSNLASLYLAQGRSDAAEPLLEKAKDHLERNPYYHYRQGIIALEAGDLPNAVRHLQQAVRRQDDDPELYTTLAEALAADGQNQQSEIARKRADTLREHHPNP